MCGLTTIVRDGAMGYLLARCPGFFAERLDGLLRNPDLLTKMRMAARPSVLRCSWKHVAEHMLTLYCDVVSEIRHQVAQERFCFMSTTQACRLRSSCEIGQPALPATPRRMASSLPSAVRGYPGIGANVVVIPEVEGEEY